MDERLKKKLGKIVSCESRKCNKKTKDNWKYENRSEKEWCRVGDSEIKEEGGGVGR